MFRFVPLLLACACTGTDVADDKADTDSDPGTESDSDTDADTDGGDTDVDTDTDVVDTEPPLDCSNIPAPPLPYTVLDDYGKAEDFDFDASGNHVAVAGGSLVSRELGMGDVTTLLVPGLGNSINGMRALPNGDFVIADRGSSSLRRVTLGGAIEVLMANINYPNGVEVTQDGKYAFVTENANPGELYQVDLDTLEQYQLFSGYAGANGIAISDDEQKIFVGTCAGTGIIALDRISDTEWSEPRVIVDHPGGCYDAINVDACGNLYYYGSSLMRMLPDEKTVEEVVDLGGWIPNARWGSDRGGWDPDTLYLNNRISGDITAVEVGVRGKRHVHAP